MNPSPAQPPVQNASPWRWWVCILLFLATTLNYMDRVSLNQMAVRIQTALDLDNQEYSRLESGFSFAFAVGAFLTGIVVDRVSVRWVYPLVVLGWSAAGVLTGYSTEFWSLLACRIMLGLFEAGNWPCGIRTTRAVLRPEERSFGNSLFQSGTALGAIVTPFLIFYLLQMADEETGGPSADSWKLPFRLIGIIGVGWVALWFLTVPSRMLTGRSEPPATPGKGRYRDIFVDRRFWALLIMVVVINIAWHTYRTWLPKYLQEKRGYDERGMASLMTWFYLIADAGSWTVGLATLVFIRRGYGGHTTRLMAFATCSLLALVGLLVPFVSNGWLLPLTVIVFAFASLGLFPTYFSMTQEVSARHQGKVTGTLGAGAHLFLSLVAYPIEGWVVKETQSYDVILSAAGAFPLVGFCLMAWLWPPRREGVQS